MRTIIKNIPPPVSVSGRPYGELSEAMKDMKPDDCIDFIVHHPSTIRSAARTLGFKVAIRKIGATKFRVWRIQPNPRRKP